ncbi:MAG: DUF1254 domain-containing protein [Pseudomonadota bacterium]
MRRLVAFLLFIIAAIGGHALTLHLVPSVIMDTAQSRLADQGLPLHQWAASPRMTPQTQTIVRPSPDLSYSVCRFDVRDGPVLISAPGWDGYGSLSIFDDRTNNVFVANLDGENAEVLILPLSDKDALITPDLADKERVLIAEGLGLALIRRVAPDAQLHEAAVSLIDQSTCKVIRQY